MLSSIFIVAVAVHHAAASASPALLPRDLSQLIYPSAAATAGGVARIWTGADLDRASSVLNYEQMKPLILRLEAGLPITVLALGDSITASHGGCFHRDRCGPSINACMVQSVLAVCTLRPSLSMGAVGS